MLWCIFCISSYNWLPMGLMFGLMQNRSTIGFTHSILGVDDSVMSQLVMVMVMTRLQ